MSEWPTWMKTQHPERVEALEWSGWKVRSSTDQTARIFQDAPPYLEADVKVSNGELMMVYVGYPLK